MALTRSFKETVIARARRDPEFRSGLIEDAIQSIKDADYDVALRLLDNVVTALKDEK